MKDEIDVALPEFPSFLRDEDDRRKFEWSIHLTRAKAELIFQLTDAEVTFWRGGDWFVIRVEVPFAENEDSMMKARKNEAFIKAVEFLWRYYRKYYRHIGVDVNEKGCFAEIWFHKKELTGERPDTDTRIMTQLHKAKEGEYEQEGNDKTG